MSYHLGTKTYEARHLDFIIGHREPLDPTLDTFQHVIASYTYIYCFRLFLRLILPALCHANISFHCQAKTDLVDYFACVSKAEVAWVPIRNRLFHHTLAESTTSRPSSKTRKCYFRPRYDEIVYYVPREEKTWTVHSSWQTRALANFTPVERILFFVIPGPKIPHSCFEPGAKVVLSGRVWRKIVYEP